MKVNGIDVHKDIIFCGIYNGKKQEKIQEFPTFTQDIINMGNKLLKEGVKRVAMESTGI